MSNMGKQIEWEFVERARALALACRLDRQLHEAVETASRPEARLAGHLRQQLQRAVAARASTATLFAVVASVHEQLAFLPKPELPTGLRVFLREVFGPRWDAEVVVAPVATMHWPRAGGEPDADEGGGRSSSAADAHAVEQPVTVIPRAELYNPLMWPLIGLQAAVYDGWEDAEQRVVERIGPGLTLAKAEALLPVDTEAAQRLWERGRSAMSNSGDYGDAAELALSLADGVLISAHRRGVTTEGAGIYGRLAAAHDEPASAVDILHAGWLHWYDHALEQLLALDAGMATAGVATHTDGVPEVGADAKEHVAVDSWVAMCGLVNGIDDLLCRSLDVAAVHRFYATEGATA